MIKVYNGYIFVFSIELYVQKIKKPKMEILIMFYFRSNLETSISSEALEKIDPKR